MSLSDNNQADNVKAFYSTSKYLDELFNIDDSYFEQMVSQIYPTELKLNKTNSSDTEAPFLDLDLSITYGIVSSNIYEILKKLIFHFLVEMFVAPPPSYGAYISQLICFARVFSYVDAFNNRNTFLTSKLLK